MENKYSETMEPIHTVSCIVYFYTSLPSHKFKKKTTTSSIQSICQQTDYDTFTGLTFVLYCFASADINFLKHYSAGLSVTYVAGILNHFYNRLK